MNTRIVGGIEWYEVDLGDGYPQEDCQCARCGSSVDFIACDVCGGDGYSDEDDDGLDCMSRAVCDTCDGERGWWHCLSSRDWCEANPREGRDHIESTAFAAINKAEV